MGSDAVQRKLAALLSADVVGYSRLMAEDEVATVRALNAHRDAMGGLVRQHGGRVVDAVGDNLLAEFPSVVDAVACASAMQHELRTRNADLPAARKMEFRIGVHLGDVIVDGARIAGDGVNIAARLEALAEPGGICISANVYDQVRDKLSLNYENLGEQTLKNIAHPVGAYRVRLTDEEGDEAAGLTVPGFAGRPAIAVLAFDNLSDDPLQEYFADGIAEDLITRLSSFRLFPVIARNSSFAYKGKAVDVKQVSRELGVRYVVEGSVRRAGDRVRVSTELVDATTGHHIWADHFDREVCDIFVLQDDITEAIMASVGPALSRAEIRRARRSSPESVDAWDCVQRALWHLSQYRREDFTEAQSWLQRAIELRPDLPAAHTLLAFSHMFEVIYQWSDSAAGSAADALSAAEKSVALDGEDPNALFALGFACSLKADYERAIAVLERAIELNPSFALAYWALGAALAPSGCPDCAIPMIEKAIRLSPYDPWMHEFLYNLGAAHFLAGRYEKAVSLARRSLQHKPDQPGAYRLAAASLGYLGRTEEAENALEALLGMVPDFSAAYLEPFLPPAVVERYLEGLRRAGWTE